MWCGFVLYHCGLVSCFFVFVVYNLKHTVHFSQPKMSQNLYCVPLVAHHEWESFVPLKLFLYWYKKSFISTTSNPSNPLKNWAGRFENDRCKRGHARGAYDRGVSLPLQGREPACKRGCALREAARQGDGDQQPSDCATCGCLSCLALFRGLSQCTSPFARWHPH